MTPTIIAKDGKPFLVVGSPGGSRIITTVLQVVLSMIDTAWTCRRRSMPRFHHQWLPTNCASNGEASRDVVKALEALGHKVTAQGDMGDVHAIWIDPKTGMRYGASDPRLDGRTIGY
jgi:gamma-glutamyltranspeptidase/glutathione hydrolase